MIQLCRHLPVRGFEPTGRKRTISASLWSTVRHLILLSFVTSLAPVFAATAGYFDPAFGNGGVVQIDYAGGDDTGTSLAPGRSGDLYVNGIADIGLVMPGVSKLRASGAYNTSFGHVDFPGRAPILTQVGANGFGLQSTGVGVLSNGMPVHTGFYTRASQSRAFLARCADVQCAVSPYSFHSGDGLEFLFPPGYSDAIANGLHVNANDEILVVGSVYQTAVGEIGWVARVRSDFTLDPLFGIATYHLSFVGLSGEYGTLFAVTSAAGGHVVVAGYTARNSAPLDNGQFLVACLNYSGYYAASFNGGAPFKFGFGSPNTDVATAVAVDGQGRIVIAGYTQYDGADYDYGVARLTPFGQLDTSFASIGKTTIAWDVAGDQQDLATGIAIDHGNKIIVSGSYRASNFVSARGVGTARLNVDGSLDASFGIDGRSKARVSGGSDDRAAALVLDSNGAIVIAGTTNSSAASQGENAFVMRLYGEGVFVGRFD